MATREYKAYLLRLWRENHEAPWRALLENPHTGDREAFATFAELVAFLEVTTGEKIRLTPAPSETTDSSTNKSNEKESDNSINQKGKRL